MKIKSIVLAIVVILYCGLTSFTLKDNDPTAKKDGDNPITITMQSNSGDRVPIVWSGKTVGYLEWSIVKYTPYRDSGGFITLSLYNDSDEYINFCITGKRANSCSECGWRLKPYQKNDEATFACSEEVSDFNFIITVEN